MLRGEQVHMKYLKIENNRGHFLNPFNTESSEWIEIDKINKDHLIELLNKAIASEFEMDDYSDDQLGNKAHQIIYKNLYDKFCDLIENKSRFKDESDRLYKDAIEKYSNSQP